jgi:predicted secreted protein
VNLETSLAIYLIVWWVVLFSVLPVGVTSHAEAGIKTPGGGDPAAPIDPKLKRKFITTTWISAALFTPFWIAVHFHWISLGMLRNFG